MPACWNRMFWTLAAQVNKTAEPKQSVITHLFFSTCQIITTSTLFWVSLIEVQTTFLMVLPAQGWAFLMRTTWEARVIDAASYFPDKLQQAHNYMGPALLPGVATEPHQTFRSSQTRCLVFNILIPLSTAVVRVFPSWKVFFGGKSFIVRATKVSW